MQDTKPRQDRFHNFIVYEPAPAGAHGIAFMDGQRLRGVRTVEVRTGYDRANEITITFIAGSINRIDHMEEAFDGQGHEAPQAAPDA